MIIIFFAPVELKHRINTQVAIKLDGYVLKNVYCRIDRDICFGSKIKFKNRSVKACVNERTECDNERMADGRGEGSGHGYRRSRLSECTEDKNIAREDELMKNFHNFHNFCWLE